MYKKLYHKFSSVDLTVAGEPRRKSVVWADNIVTEIPRKSLDNLDSDEDRANEKIPLHPVPDYLPSWPVQYESPSAMKSRESRDQEKTVCPQPRSSDWASHWARERKWSSTPSVQTLDTKPAFSWMNIPFLKKMSPQKPDKKRDVYNVSAPWQEKPFWKQTGIRGGGRNSDDALSVCTSSDHSYIPLHEKKDPVAPHEMRKHRRAPVIDFVADRSEQQYFADQLQQKIQPEQEEEMQQTKRSSSFVQQKAIEQLSDTVKREVPANEGKDVSTTPKSRLDKWKRSPGVQGQQYGSQYEEDEIQPFIETRDLSESQPIAVKGKAETKSPKLTKTRSWLDKWKWSPVDEHRHAVHSEASAAENEESDVEADAQEHTAPPMWEKDPFERFQYPQDEIEPVPDSHAKDESAWLDKWKWSSVEKHEDAAEDFTPSSGSDEENSKPVLSPLWDRESLGNIVPFDAPPGPSGPHAQGLESPTKGTQLDKWKWSPGKKNKNSTTLSSSGKNRNSNAGDRCNEAESEMRPASDSPKEGSHLGEEKLGRCGLDKFFNSGDRFNEKASEMSIAKSLDKRSQLNILKQVPCSQNKNSNARERYSIATKAPSSNSSWDQNQHGQWRRSLLEPNRNANMRPGYSEVSKKPSSKSPKRQSQIDKLKWSPVKQDENSKARSAMYSKVSEKTSSSFTRRQSHLHKKNSDENTNFSAGRRFSEEGASEIALPESPTIKQSQLDKWRWTPVEKHKDLAAEPRYSDALEIASAESIRNKDFNAGRRFSEKASEVASPKKSSSKSPQQQPSQLDKWRWSPGDRNQDLEPIARYHDTSEMNFKAERKYSQVSESETPGSPRRTQSWLDRWRWTPADEGQRSSTYDISAVVPDRRARRSLLYPSPEGSQVGLDGSGEDQRTMTEDSGSGGDSSESNKEGSTEEDQKKKEPFM